MDIAPSNKIRLTDRFIIERVTDDGPTNMTVDGHDLKEFTLELQSSFTEEVEASIFALQNQGASLEVDLVDYRNLESKHYGELDERITEQNFNVTANTNSIRSQQAQIDKLYETTRIIGRYFMVEKTPANLGPGEMSVKFKTISDGNPAQLYYKVEKLYFHVNDLISIDGLPAPYDGSDEKSFDNLFAGDLIEISDSNTVSLISRALYEVMDSPVVTGSYATVDVRVVQSGGDNDGFPWQDPNANPVRDMRIEVFPSAPTDTFLELEDYNKFIQKGFPIGTIMAWISNTPPAGYLICNGQSISANKYATLRSIIGNSLPDLRGRALIGQGNYTGVKTLNRAVSQSTSAPTKSLSSSSAGSHSHSSSIDTAGNHNHRYGNNTLKGGGTKNTAYSAIDNKGDYKTTQNGAHTHTVTISSDGSHSHTISGWDSYNRMNSHTVHWIIKAEHVELEV